MKRGWFVLMLMLVLFGILTLTNSVYWLVIGYGAEYGSGFIIGPIILSLVLLAGAYESWKRARKP